MSNIVKLLEFNNSIGVNTSVYTSVIMMNMVGLNYDYEQLTTMKLNIVANLPFDPRIVQASFEQKIYLRDSMIVDKRYKKQLINLCKLITES
jgi:hypothetical protein